MKFEPVQDLPGVWLIELEPREDERGFLTRTYCEEEFAAHGLVTRWPQCNLTLTRKKGAIRGMHFQDGSRPEIKLIRCAAGAIYDVLVDVRPASATFGSWKGFELTARNHLQLYVPAGFAHGFQCQINDCEVYYQMSAAYAPALSRGIRHDDPELKIAWPLPITQVSARDGELPLLSSLRSQQ